MADQQLTDRRRREPVRAEKDLAVIEKKNACGVAAAHGQLSRFPEQREHLEELGELQIFETADQ